MLIEIIADTVDFLLHRGIAGIADFLEPLVEVHVDIKIEDVGP